VHHQGEVEWSRYNFEEADVPTLIRHFDDWEREALRLIQAGLALPAYDATLKTSHLFNLLDARGAISVTERMTRVLRVRTLARACAELWERQRFELGFPMIPDPALREKRLAAHREKFAAPAEKE
jgi:glycyl-tRNA synthetase alpha chain